MQSLRTVIAVCKLSCIFHFFIIFCFFPGFTGFFSVFRALFCSFLLRCVFFWFFGLLPFVESYDHVLSRSSLKAENCFVSFFGFLAFCLLWKVTTMYTFMVIAEGRNWFVSFLVFWPSAFCGKLQSCTFVVIAESRKLVKPEIFDIFGLTEKK